MKRRIPVSEQASVDIGSVNKEELADVTGLTFDYTVPRAARGAWITAAVKNPYCFRVGGMGVMLEFSEGAPTFQAVFSDFLKRKKSGI